MEYPTTDKVASMMKDATGKPEATLFVCDRCNQRSFTKKAGTPCNADIPRKARCRGTFQLYKKPTMTQQEVENWIMLKGQTDKRWFKIEILDEEVGQDPTMIALMESVSDMIFAGIQGMPFMESETLRAKKQAAKKSEFKLVD